MTEDTAQESHEADDEVTLADARPKDWMLEALARIYGGADGKSSLGLTIQSNGATISGMMITTEAFLTILGAQFKTAGTDALEPLLKRWAEDMAEFDATNEKLAEQGKNVPARQYIHMRDVRVFSGSATIELAIWRGTLADVTGWSLGISARD
ncbi:hypothetical protein M2317_000054 [Microbacterium sp. ZKA21]|uniref:hypothetical protein n=1 Tax=Microbacterium sp. ZKA21 TaxID=3381694 RepID=UPI003D1CAF97